MTFRKAVNRRSSSRAPNSVRTLDCILLKDLKKKANSLNMLARIKKIHHMDESNDFLFKRITKSKRRRRRV